MARPIWRGAISFGMVTIPVKLYTATESKDVAFRQVHNDDCKSRIRQLRWCPVHDREVAYDELIRGYEYAKDRFVLFEDEDFEKLPLPSRQTISLAAFVDASEIDPTYHDRTYYLEPDETGRKAFALLVRALEAKGLTAIAKVAIRNKERLSALRLSDGRLVLETLLWPDEIRAREEDSTADIEVSDDEMKMALTLIEMLEQPFDPGQFHDEYRDALTTIIDAKLAGEEVVVAEQPETAKVIDLMAALKASVEATKAARGGSAPSGGSAGSDEGDSKAQSKRRRAKAG